MMLFWQLLLGLAWCGIVASSIFLVLVVIAARRFKQRSQGADHSGAAPMPAQLPPVTILKPVHGMEARLQENLESFFQQDYPDF